MEFNKEDIVLMGHSFGGVTALYSALLDLGETFKAVIGLDPWLYPMPDEFLS